ncbi:conserved protein of unknown function [Tenacibaculum soleae]
MELEQARKEEGYIQNIKGFYKLLSIGVLSLLVPLVLAINEANFWYVFL